MTGWKQERAEKGKSLIALPLDYVVIDTETTGLDSRYCNLIEASALRVRGGKVVDRFSSLIQPPRLDIYLDGEWLEAYVDGFIMNFTGITNEMLSEAPKPKTVLPQLAEFLGNDILLGHNVSFDVNFIYDAFQKTLNIPLRNDYLDNLRISRKLQPELPHHRLGDIAESLGISYEGAHRAEADCHITNSCYLRLREKALEDGTEEDFLRLFDKKRRPAKKELQPTVTDFDPKHPFYQKHVAITGRLSAMTRREALQRVVNAGGINQEIITRETDFLVVGSTGASGGADGTVFQSQGITILSEKAFLNLLGASSSGTSGSASDSISI